MRSRFFAVLFVLAVACTLVGCDVSLETTASSADMQVGDYLDLREFTTADFDSVELSDPELATLVTGTVLYAEKSGRLTVTLFRGSASAQITVNISYREELTLTCSSPLFTTVRGSVLEFYAELGQFADRNTGITWYVDGSFVQSGGRTFKLNMSNYGSREVSVKTQNGSSASLTAVCYEEFSLPPIISADSVGTLLPPYKAVEFSCNQSGFLEWKVNGEHAFYGETFSFTPPEAGKYVISATVNGVETNSLELLAGGVVVPKNLTIDFDSCFPRVILSWKLSAPLKSEIKVGNAVVSTEENFLDITDFVDFDAPNEVAVRCLGGDDFAPSDFVTVTTPIIGDTEREYLSRNFPGGNYYLSSDEEAYRLIEYALVFRGDPEAKHMTINALMGYDSTLSAATLLTVGWARASQTGIYGMSASGSTKKGEVVIFKIGFRTPIVPSPDERQKTTAKQLVTPHFGSGLSEFPIDEREGVSVTTSEELFYVVEKGFKPLPTVGSAAERLYNKARAVLSSVASDDMSEADKARVIYEWIMWHTTYDDEVVGEPVAVSCTRPAYYLEGVLDYGFAVCDGISKTMSLLCNMVGLPCVRVVGMAESNDVLTAHAWNYVEINGKWYIVDATWGDKRATVGNVRYESGTHEYFLKSASQLPTHKPSFPDKYPTADTYFNWFDATGLYVKEELTPLEEIAAKIEENITFSVTAEETDELDFYCAEILLARQVVTYYTLHGEQLDKLMTSLNARYRSLLGNILVIIIDKNQFAPAA